MTPWDIFFREKVTKIFTDKERVIDVGGGLRFDRHRGNRFDPAAEWISPLASKVKYEVLDPVPDYSPDIVGDIHNLPFGNNSIPALVCMAVLEHVEDPFQAMREIHRVLEPGGYALLYVPFLFYYHAEPGYYNDFWRFTEDGVRHLARNFTMSEYVAVRGALETWLKLSPLGNIAGVLPLARLLDWFLGKRASKQVSGFTIFLTK